MSDPVVPGDSSVHSILPDTFIENIRVGRAAIVVGTNWGGPDWKDLSWGELLGRMNAKLRARGQEEEAVDIDVLLEKGNLVRAAAFLRRRLGNEACDGVLAETWGNSEQLELPALAQSIAQLPVRQIWTTFPGDLLERALTENQPEDWPASTALTPTDLSPVTHKRRTLLKLLGDFDSSYVITPISVRRALANTAELLEFIRPFYLEGSLLFVGFRDRDPDLVNVLDRLLSTFPPSDGAHYMICPDVGPVSTDELREHNISVLDEGDEGTLRILADLGQRCTVAEVSLVKFQPEADDLDGWWSLLQEDENDQEAIAAIACIETKARDNDNPERLIEVLMIRIEMQPEAQIRAQLLQQVADVLENQMGDIPGAFTALTAALREYPADLAAVTEAERLASQADGWTELVGDVAQVVADIETKSVAAQYYARLGRWYHRKLDRLDYAVASFREAIRRDETLLEAYDGLSEAYRVQQRWGELADLIDVQLELAEAADDKFDLYLSMADICESQLASTSRAIAAYEASLMLDTDVTDGFVGLERLLRHSEDWGKLAKVLERKADYWETRGNAAQAAAVRRDLTAMRADKLGDLQGVVNKYEAALEEDAEDIEALQALEDLYDKLGRTDEYLKTLRTLAEVSPADEQPPLFRRLAMELEELVASESVADVSDTRDLAIASWTRLIALEETATDAYRALERLYRTVANWDSLADTLKQHAKNEKSASGRVDLYTQAAKVYEVELADPHQAIDVLELAESELDSGDEQLLAALARLYTRTELFREAVNAHVKCAQALAKGGGEHWAQAGIIALVELKDWMSARNHLEKALELLPEHVQALAHLARLHRAEGAWESAVNRLVDAADASANRLDRAEFLLQGALICRDELHIAERASTLLKRVLEVDPEHVAAGIALSEQLVTAGQFREALPLLEMVARRTDAEDRVELVERNLQAGTIALSLGVLDKAEEHLGRVVQLDPTNLEAALEFTNALYAAAREDSDVGRWEVLDQRCRGVLAQHRSSLSDDQLVELWFRIGVAAQRMGDPAKAEAALRRGLERDPGHLRTLRELAKVALQREDWKSLVTCKRDMLDCLSEEERGMTLEEIGDLTAEKLSDPESALGAYLSAIKIRPGERGLLHKALELLTEQKQWRQAVEVLSLISNTEKTAERRAKFHYAAAVICRDKLADSELAVEYFTRALDDNPTTDKAFDAIDKLLSSKEDWKGLVRAHRKMLKAVDETAPEALQLRLWTRLGDICAEQLGDAESAITAYEVAVSINPADTHRREQLVDLYLEVGGHRLDVIDELQALIAADPDRVELYRVLGEQYRGEGDFDKAFCVAQALVFLRAANTEEAAVYEDGRPKAFVASTRRLTEELWQKAVIHGNEDRHVNAIFASVLPQVAATTAQPISAFDVTDRPSEANTALSRVFHYATGMLGLTPEPILVVDASDSSGGVRVANTVHSGRLAPALVASLAVADADNEVELAFELGKRMAYCRPDRYLNFAMQTLPKLESAFYGALDAAGVKTEGHDTSMSSTLQKTVPSAMLEQVGAIAAQMNIAPSNGVISSWRSATDLTANRVGLILCNDLQTAAKVIATERSTQSTLSAKDRLRDLLAYSVSDEYFAVRRHLGLNVSAR